MKRYEPLPIVPEEEPIVSELRRLGENIADITAERNDAHLPNSNSVFLPYADGARLTLIHKEEGAAKIGPEFVIQDQYTEGASSLKSLTFRWPEKYPMDRRTWGLTFVDSSLPEAGRRRSVTGGAFTDDEMEKLNGLIDKTKQVIANG